jgi:signal transduction histidine kinase
MATGFPERYRPIDALPSAAAYVDADGRILVENEPFRELRSVHPGAIPAEAFTLPRLFADEEREVIREMLGEHHPRLRRAARAFSVVGSPTRMFVECVPIMRRSGGNFWLVTLRPARSGAKLSDDLVSRATVTAGIVHDLRAPVQLVLGWAALLRRQDDEPDRIEHAMTIIERNAVLVMSLLEDLLEQTRATWVRAPRRPHHVDFVELVRAEVKAVQNLADERRIAISLAVESPAVAVEGDETHFRRVVVNLLGNALKSTPAGGAGECKVWSSDGWAGISVRDTGPGIPRELLPRVFEPFAHHSKRPLHKDEGLEPGLAIVRQLVERHGGTVTAESAGSGSGATFTVRLPEAGRGFVAASA